MTSYFWFFRADIINSLSPEQIQLFQSLMPVRDGQQVQFGLKSDLAATATIGEGHIWVFLQSPLLTADALQPLLDAGEAMGFNRAFAFCSADWPAGWSAVS